ncbi:hypothetical protein [Ekhidna sp.]
MNKSNTKAIFFYLLTVTSIGSTAQSHKNIIGAWRQVEVITYEEKESDLPIKANGYLRYEFKNQKKLKISTHHTQNASNSPTIGYKIEKDVLIYGFERRFLIVEVNKQKLVLVDLEGGLKPNSTKHIFIREQLYLDNLPTNPEDRIQFGNETSYLISEKLTPSFETVNPDFHQFVSMRMNTSYEEGENYTHAALAIHPNGDIGKIQILHHVNKETDQKFLAAIKKSRGLWTLPKLNGKEVPITIFVEDRDIGKQKITSEYSFSITPISFEKYTDDYLKSFNAFSKSYLRGNIELAMTHLNKCEKILPNEPNVQYAKYLCYTRLGNKAEVEQARMKVNESKLSYLLTDTK